MKRRRSFRQRLVGYAVFMGLLALAVMQLGWVYHDDSEEEYTSVQVKYGDTIWDLASRNMDDNTDIRYVIFNIVEMNHLDGSQDIYPGQVIKIPIHKSAR